VKPSSFLDFGFSIRRFQSQQIICLALSALLFAICSVAEAQQKKLARIGFLSATLPSFLSARFDAFQQGLRELGYVEGQNIMIEWRFAEAQFDRVVHNAAELVRLKVDLIVTDAPAATGPAKEATSTIPIVMAQESDPVGSGFVASLAQPEGNITGLSTLAPELSGKQLELLKEIVPNLSRVAVLGNATEPGNAQSLREIQVAAGVVGVQLQYLDIRSPEDTETAFSAIRRERASAFIVLRNPVTSAHRNHIMDIAAKNRLPAIYANREWVDAGGLMFYGANILDNWRRAATYVDKILKGAKPADLPVERPIKFELVINLKTAKQIGLTIPPQVLARADRVIR
jgi:putative tryptophan/tyrosine transport system substrate-binding protein